MATACPVVELGRHQPTLLALFRLGRQVGRQTSRKGEKRQRCTEMGFWIAEHASTAIDRRICTSNDAAFGGRLTLRSPRLSLSRKQKPPVSTSWRTISRVGWSSHSFTFGQITTARREMWDKKGCDSLRLPDRLKILIFRYKGDKKSYFPLRRLFVACTGDPVRLCRC